MKKIVLAMLLVTALTAVAQTTSAPSQPAQQQNPAPSAAAPATPAPPKKEMKDPAEYNAYMGAQGQTDDTAKISGFEAFLTQYPNSAYKEDALELLMGAYQKTNNQAKVLDTAQRVLQVNPCNLRALAVLAYTKQAQQKLPEAGQAGEKGLQCIQTATKPDGMSAPDWDKLKSTTAGIFNNAGGMAAYAAKDFQKAEQYLRAAVAADPTNLTEVYYLALADLSPGPAENDVEGLFYIARAADLQTGEGKAKIADFGKKKYKNYHGSEEGWSDLLAQATTATKPPDNLTIAKYVPPTPAQQCTDLLKSKKIEEMSFAEWQLCLSEGTPEDTEKVWTVLKGKPLQMVAHIISIDSSSKTATKLTLAGSSDDIDAKRADIELTMSAAIPAKQMPKEDADFEFQGTPVSYAAKPFVMTMSDGALLVKAAPKPPVHRKPAAH
jgi:tetratricopeptide (TPR) repeat protein